jgi:hypothetical protein
MKHAALFTALTSALTLVANTSTAQSLDTDVPQAQAMEPVRVAQAPASSGAATVPTFDAHQYHQRSTTLFGTASLGYGVLPGINPYFNPGVNLSFTVRSIWSGFLLDAGLDFTFSVLCLARSCAAFSLQPSVRAGYTGSVSSRVALGFRGGYAPGFVFGGYSNGFVHQLDADLHVTVTTTRGAIIEPFLGGGILIASPLSPVGLLGLRIGATL